MDKDDLKTYLQNINDAIEFAHSVGDIKEEQSFIEIRDLLINELNES